MLDLTPATDELARIVTGIAEDDLTAATPNEGMTVADLLDHVDGLAHAFARAAGKDPLPGPPNPDGANLRPDWRTGIPQRLADLALAWKDPDAWTGMTAAGGLDLPGEVAATIAIDEVVVHGWDLATATGQFYAADPAAVAAAYEFARSSVEQAPEGTPGLYGPPVPVPADAPLFYRLIGLTGRDPGPVAEAMSRDGTGTGGLSPVSRSQPLAWSVAQRKFTQGGWFWLSTVRPDGRPHTMPVMAVWAAPVFYVASKAGARKSRNLDGNEGCVLIKDAGDLHLVVEGRAHRVTDADGLARASARYNESGWPTTVAGDELDAPFGAPTSGGPPYRVYAITPAKAFSFPTDGESSTPTRWRFTGR